jgi:predicted NUDIX family NTP pyrophosphohydrolase
VSASSFTSTFVLHHLYSVERRSRQWVAYPKLVRMKKQSAGILLFRTCTAGLEVFLVHPGGPYWTKKDAGAWSIPKGEYSDGEDPLAAAKREFEEETGVAINGDFISLGEVKQTGGKVVKAWALKHDLDPVTLKSNTFQLEWPPRSGTIREFPEVDTWAWFSLPVARRKIIARQEEFLTRLAEQVHQRMQDL